MITGQSMLATSRDFVSTGHRAWQVGQGTFVRTLGPNLATVLLLSFAGQHRSRLESLKLVEPAADAQEDIGVNQLIDNYLSELGTKPRTVTRYRNQLQFLRDFAGGKVISELTSGDGDRFLKWLRKKKKKNGEPYAPNYIAKIVKTSRQVFAYGHADNLLSINPLAGVSAPERIDEERDFEITREMTEAILDGRKSEVPP